MAHDELNTGKAGDLVLLEDNGKGEQNRIEEKRVIIEDNGKGEQNRREESSYRR